MKIRSKKIKFLFIALLVLVLFIFLTNIVIYLKSKPYIYRDTKDVPEVQTVLIPGAAVFSDGTLSQFFRDRVDTAIDLYQLGTVQKILVSGDNSTVWHNEVNPVRTYLLGKGIPDADIYLDHAGFDTYSTMYRARDIFQVTSVVISTQSFHLPRAVFLARSLGLKAYGISVDSGHVLFKNYIREMLADEKAVLNLLLHRKPKFLGDIIPINGEQKNYVDTDIPTKGHYCFARTQVATTDAPYSVEEHVVLNFDGTSVTGTKHGTQAGPDMTNGYQGTLVGAKTANQTTNEMELIYAYTVEGAKNKELEVYTFNKDNLVKERWVLKDAKINGASILVPDYVGDPTLITYQPEPCK